MWMWMWIVVSNTNDHGGGKCGCGNGSLYRIQMIMVVMSINEELDHCIKYKRSCEVVDRGERMVVVRRKEQSVDSFFIYYHLMRSRDVTM